MNFQPISLTVIPNLPYATCRRGSRIPRFILITCRCFNPRQSPTHCSQCLLLSDLENEPLRLVGTVLISIKECFHTHLVREGDNLSGGKSLILQSFCWKREEFLSQAGTENARKVSELTFSPREQSSDAELRHVQNQMVHFLLSWSEKSRSYLKTHLILLYLCNLDIPRPQVSFFNIWSDIHSC